ncbi:MAG: CPBP family intramembrane metalloprotease [Planctomycetota bacterium]|nr:CPBP family intramembrane metalloprotease [Planctomycetota bacterium]
MAEERRSKKESWVTSFVLVLPLMIGYVAGIILLGPKMVNGADVINPFILSQLGFYGLLGFNLALIALCLFLISYLKKRDRFDPKRFLPTILESSFYAVTMGSFIIFVMKQTTLIAMGTSDRPPPLEGLVISLGAGVNEELFFRVGLLGALAYLGEDLLGLKKGSAVVMAIILSSVAFSLAHYLGAEEFQGITFVYRCLAGVIFSVVYKFRSFAIAVYTHTLYDIMVLVVPSP